MKKKELKKFCFNFQRNFLFYFTTPKILLLNDDIDNEYFLSDDLIEMDEGSGNDQIDITEEPSDQIDFGFIQEVTYF